MIALLLWWTTTTSRALMPENVTTSASGAVTIGILSNHHRALIACESRDAVAGALIYARDPFDAPYFILCKDGRVLWKHGPRIGARKLRLLLGRWPIR